MKIFNYLKNIITKNNNRNQLLLDLPKNLYADLIKSSEIDNIINNVPSNFSKIEKAYYIYLELGKIISENLQFVFTDKEGKESHYNDLIDDKFAGICKSISELYVSILADERIGISADLVKNNPESSITHVDTILKIDEKNYIVNLISDLSRIKTSRRINGFCYDLSRNVDDQILQKHNEEYLKRLEKYYGKISTLKRSDIEKLDKKLNYSFWTPNFKENERGLYTEDVIELLRKDMNNPEYFKKYVLHNKNVSEDEILIYKLNYMFENINKLTDYNSNMNYLENIRYYLYVDEDKKYIQKTPEEMKKIIDNLDKESVHIIGMFDRFKPQKIDELELSDRE